jgi:hypothetical protein
MKLHQQWQFDNAYFFDLKPIQSSKKGNPDLLRNKNICIMKTSKTAHDSHLNEFDIYFVSLRFGCEILEIILK